MGPPIAVYVVAAVAGIAAGYVFKEVCVAVGVVPISPLSQYVYEPHIAPFLEAWAEEFLARRRARSQRRAAPVPASSPRRRSPTPSSSDNDTGDDPSRPLTSRRDSRNRRRRRRRNDRGSTGGGESFELEGLVADEVDEWRNQVQNQQTDLRRRRRPGLGLGERLDGSDIELDFMSSTLDDSFTFRSLAPTPITPTHVVWDSSSPLSDSASLPSASQSPAPTDVPSRDRSISQSTTTLAATSTTIQDWHPINDFPVELPKSPSDRTEMEPPSSLTSPHLITIPRMPGIMGPSSSASGSGTISVPSADRDDEDSPFGPILPESPRSSSSSYAARPFSPIMWMTTSSPPSSGSQASRQGSGSHDSPVPGLNTDAEMDYADSSIASLSLRYPAPPTPPVLVSPPSSAGVRSLPNTSTPTSPAWSVPSPPPHSRLPVAALQVPDHLSAVSSPTLSFASFASPLSIARTITGSEIGADAEFLSVADSDSEDGNAGRGGTGVRTFNPFSDFEELRDDDSDRGSEEVVVHSGSDGGSDGSWGSHGSAGRH